MSEKDPLVSTRVHTTFDTDVLVVGGGPSGAICAYYLAKAGKKVILIDSQTFPRDKICGDLITPLGLKELADIGITDQHKYKATNIVTSATIYMNGQPVITKNFHSVEGLNNYSRVIPRYLLDNWITIINVAKGQGVQVVTDCNLESYTVSDEKVTINCKHKDQDKQFLAKVLIGADGSNSTVARISRGKKPNTENKGVAVRAYFENVNCISQHVELFIKSDSFPGYYWFFPTGPTTANVGIGMMLKVFPKAEVSLKELLLDAIENDASLKDRIGNGTLVKKIEGWPLSLYDPDARIVYDRVVLIGDAAGLINPLNGEGIHYALQSGRWAAESVLSCFATDTFTAKSLNTFKTKIRHEIGYDLSLANILLQVLQNRHLNPLWLELTKVIINQAKQDDKYAFTAAGVLAGMIPARKAIRIYFVRKSIYQAIIMSYNRAPFKIVMLAAHSFTLLSDALAQSVKQKKTHWDWVKRIVKAIFLTIKLFIMNRIDKALQ